MFQRANQQGRNILVLASTYPRWHGDHEPGFVHELARRLVPKFRVIVLCPHAPRAAAEEVMDGVEVRRFRYAPSRLETLVHNGGIVNNLRRSPWKFLLLPGFFVAQCWATSRLLRTRRISVIHAHWLIPQGIAVWLLSRLCRIPPYVVTSHGGDLFSLRGRLMSAAKWRVISGASAMTVVSSAMYDEALRLGAKADGLKVIPMGVDFETRFRPRPDAQRDACQLLSVGRLVPKKGLHILLQALPRVAARYPDVQLTIIGYGPEESRLRALVSQLDLDGRVTFAGALPQEELVPHYRQATAFVAPFVREVGGDQEGLPVALMEAIACECPIVTTTVAGIDDLLGAVPSPFCVAPDDAPRFADAICAMLAVDDEERHAAAVALRARIIERVDWRGVSERYAQVLESASRL